MTLAVRVAGLGLGEMLVDGGEAGGVEGGTGGDEGDGDDLRILISGIEGDAAGVDALFANEVGLGVDGALGGEVRAVGLVDGGVADEGERGVCGAEEVEGGGVEESLGFVVDAGRAAAVAGEAGFAERSDDRGDDGRDGYIDGDVLCGGLAEVVGDVDRDEGCAGAEAGGGEDGDVVVGGEGALVGGEVIGEGAALCAEAVGGDGGGFAGEDGGG